MLIAVAREEHLPEWLYPYRVPPMSGEALHGFQLRDVDFVHLWLALNPTAAKADAFDDPAWKEFIKQKAARYESR